MKACYLILFLFFVSVSCFGQNIHPIKVVPANPTPSDQVEVIFTVTTPNMGHQLEFLTNFSGNNLFVGACYFQGALTAPRVFSDTVQLGNLPAGLYTINFTAVGSTNPQQCNNSGQNSASTTFLVSSPTGIAANTGMVSLQISPNPASGNFLTVSAARPITNAAIYDLAGNLVISVQKPEAVGGKLHLNIENLPRGMYFLISEIDGAISRNRFIRN